MRPPRIRNLCSCLAAFALLLLGVVSASAAPCPQSCANNTFDGTVCSTSPTRDHANSNSCYPNPGFVQTHESWNLVAGSIQVSAASCYFAPVNGYASVDVHDRFRLVGPAGSAPISFQAKLATTGSADGFGTVSAGLREVGGGSQTVNDAGFGGFATTLALSLSHVVGEEFELAMEVNVSAQNIGSAQGQLAFAGLPPGYGVTSCQGYAGEGSVAARRTTWSAVKSFYR